MFFSRSANALRVTSRASRLATRAAAQVARRHMSAAVMPALLPPHPLYTSEATKPGEVSDRAEEYTTKGYTEYPDGMNAFHTPNVIFFQELQERYAAITELIETKDDSIILSKWFALFPALVRATKDDPELYELAFEHTEGLAEHGPLYAALKKWVASEAGIEALKGQQAYAQYQIDEFLGETPAVLSIDQINHVLGLSPADQKEFLWDEYGYDLDQRAKAAGVSHEEYIKSLGLTDAKIMDAWLREIKGEVKMILKYQLFVPSLDADKAIRAHLESQAVKDAMAEIRSGKVTDAAKAAALLDTVIGLPKKKIGEIALQIIRDVPTNSNIESQEKDYLRLNYFDPEMGQENVSDPLKAHKYSFSSMDDGDPYKYARVAFLTLVVSGFTLIMSCGTEHFHWIHETGLWPGSRSAKFWESQKHLEHL